MLFISFLQIIFYFVFKNAAEIRENRNSSISLVKQFLDKDKFDCDEQAKFISNLISNENCYVLYLDDMKLTAKIKTNQQAIIFPEILCTMTLIKELTVENCGIESIPNALSDLQNLRYLNLSGNKFTKIPEVIFKILNLAELYMRNNFITYISGNIKSLCYLQTLDLDDNYLKSVCSDFQYLFLLEQFSISNNNHNKRRTGKDNHIFEKSLENLPRFLSVFTANNISINNLYEGVFLPFVKTISLRNNSLSIMPRILEKFDSLKILDLSFNNFIQIPKELFSLNNLEKLILDDNSIHIAILEIGYFKNLKYLSIKKNKMSELSLYEGALPNISKLYLGDNTLKVIKIHPLNLRDRFSDIFELFKNLNCLEITFKYKDQIKCLDYFKNISWLKLSFEEELGDNKQCIENSFKLFLGFQNLKTIKLNNSGLVNIPEVFSHIPTLKKLDLSNNMIRTITENEIKLDLYVLNLNHNQIQTLCTKFFFLSNIKKIYLSHNNLSLIPPFNGIWAPERILTLDNNPLNPFSTSEHMGILEIPPTYVENIIIIGMDKFYINFKAMLESSMFKTKNPKYKWDVDKIRTLKSIDVEKHSFEYNDLKIFFIRLISHLDNTDLIVRFVKYFNVLYKEETEQTENKTNEILQNVIKDYFESLILILQDKNPEEIKDVLNTIGSLLGMSYCQQLIILIQIIQRYKVIEQNTIILIVSILLNRFKNDAFKYVTTSNTYKDNSKILEYWKARLFLPIGFEQEPVPQVPAIPFDMLKFEDYVIFQIFKKFSVNKTVNELKPIINSSSECVIKMTKLLYSKNLNNTVRLNTFFIFEEVNNVPVVIGIHEEGITEYLLLEKFIISC
ncbi:Leucine rich repeat protein [Spraguea lophii 42_110]|uniref:Leucine rich repeat protein n=1 Tax=Spraguea lophii (strain 42_110) TaxID=1358809 RepID=S7W9N4_SPRLO|nr:Leucine rich repeat protein [Spraguea lophii 42_110]